MHDTDQIVRDLQQLLENDAHELGDLLEKSLRQAEERARQSLRSDLFQTLEWPRDLDSYYDYLRGFIRWIPQQTDDPAWKNMDPGERYAQEVSDRLSHFFFLVDQKVDEGETAVAQNSDRFRDWLTEFARQWGSYLDTPESFSQELLDSFVELAPEYGVEESLVDGRPNMPSGWLTFNQFFARQLNAGLRPIAEPCDNHVVTSPADCSYRNTFAVDADSNIPATTIKATHRYGNVEQLLEGSRYADAFANGTFVHYMLPPSAYHRYHLPVSGRVEESFVVQGKVYQQVDLEGDQLVSRDSAQTGYEFSQTRGVVTIDTSGSDAGDVGVVAVVPVGMGNVASVNLHTEPGRPVAKGDEFGYFQFGGSDIIVLFQEGVNLQVDTDESMRKVGSVIARCLPGS